MSLSSSSILSRLDGRTLRSALGALALGVVILAVVGFAPQPAFHNAAHDTRHVAVFPCH